MDTIKVKKNQIKRLLEATFPEYSGRSFRITPAERVTLVDVNWGGGTRNSYRGCTIEGVATGDIDHIAWKAPWTHGADGASVAIPPGGVLAVHEIFCGKDLGIRFYVHPTNIAPLLPPA